MVLIAGMADKKSNTEPKLYVRTRPALRSSVKRLLLDLNEADVFAQRRYTLKQEGLIQALWLMAADMDKSELAATLLPYVERVEAMLDEPVPAGRTKKAADAAPKVIAPPPSVGPLLFAEEGGIKPPRAGRRKKSGR